MSATYRNKRVGDRLYDDGLRVVKERQKAHLKRREEEKDEVKDWVSM